MAAQKFFEGQEFHNPQDPNAPVLVYHGGKFFPKDASGAVTGMPATKLSPEDADGLKSMISDAQSKELMASRAQQFMQRQDAGKGVGTGPAYGSVHIPFLGDFSPGRMIRDAGSLLGDDTPAKLQSMDAINSATWTALRPKGSGPIRNYEAAGWKKAFPNTTNYHDANADIATRLGSEAQESAAKLKFVQDFVHSGRGGVGDAIAAFAAQGAAPPPRATANAALKARSAQARGPVVIDLDGRPVSQ